MAEEKNNDAKAPEKNNRDEVALELMKFIAVTTGYGKGTPSAGFGGKATAKSPEEYAESLLELFDRCRQAVAKPVAGAES
jgi:ATP:corrinoid adenosyltransferase